MEVIDATRARAESVIRLLEHENEKYLGGASGFYCNRGIIRRSARESRMRCFKVDRSIAGFATFTVYRKHSAIEIFEILPPFRGLGLGRQLAMYMIDLLLSMGLSHISVECAPQSTEPFWRKVGFESNEGVGKPFGNPKLILRSTPNFDSHATTH